MRIRVTTTCWLGCGGWSAECHHAHEAVKAEEQRCGQLGDAAAWSLSAGEPQVVRESADRSGTTHGHQRGLLAAFAELAPYQKKAMIRLVLQSATISE
jgi:hypothetical protein